MTRLALGGLAGVAAVVLLAGTAARGQDADAEKIKKLNRITGTEAMREALVGLAKKENEKESKALVAAGLKVAKDKPEDMSYTTSYMLGLLARNFRDSASARPLLKLATRKAIELESAYKTYESYENLIDVIMIDKKYDEAAAECDDFIKKGLGRQSNEFRNLEALLRERLVQALSAGGKYDRALKIANDLAEMSDDPRIQRLKGDVYHDAERYEEAEQVYIQVLRELQKGALDTDDEEGRMRKGELSITRYMLSSIYVDLKKIDKAAEQLLALLKDAPDNPTYNNDLGYIWADHDMKLDEAETMIRKAIATQETTNKKIVEAGGEARDTASYLDSLGWVLFKKKKFAEAKKELLEAVKQKEGMHIEILDHLAQVHQLLGEKDDAIRVWEQAMKQDAERRRDKKIKAEIEEKLKKAKDSK